MVVADLGDTQKVGFYSTRRCREGGSAEFFFRVCSVLGASALNNAELPVNLSPVANREHLQFTTGEIENHPVVAYAKPILTDCGVVELDGEAERIASVPL